MRDGCVLGLFVRGVFRIVVLRAGEGVAGAGGCCSEAQLPTPTLARHGSTRYKKLHSFSYGKGIQILRASLTRRAASASACNFDIL